MDNENTPAREMPRYRCHKEVWALKIENVTVEYTDDTHTQVAGATLKPADAGYDCFKVDADYVTKHKPQIGGYYVVYDDGYKSYSPAAPFEAGYALVA